MADKRYWQGGHPERPAYVGWVTEGWQALGSSSHGGGTGGLVFVRAYDRSRNGKAEHVSAYVRGAGTSGRGTSQPAAVLPVAAGRYPGSGRSALDGPPGPEDLDAGGGGFRPSPPPVTLPLRAPSAAGPLRPSPGTVEELTAATPRVQARKGGQLQNPPEYDRGGGVAQRQADLEGLAGRFEREVGQGYQMYSLPDGRWALIRPGTLSKELTMEIQVPKPDGRGGIRTHKFRYGPVE